MEATNNLFEQGDELFAKGEYEKAEEQFKKALSKSENPLGLIRLGQCQLQLQKYTETQKSLEKAQHLLSQVKTKEDSYNQAQSKLYYTLGKLYNEGFNDNEKALEYCGQAKKFVDKDSEAITNLNNLISQLKFNSGNQENSQDSEKIDEKRFKQAKIVKEMIKNMDTLVVAGSKWYIVSMNWIEQWQKYTYFDLLENTASSINQQERKHPGQISNKDIVTEIPQFLEDTRSIFKWQNVQLKQTLKEGEQFMLVDEQIFEFWKKEYGCDIDIIRYGIIVNEETEEAIVEIYLKEILIYPIPNKKEFDFNNPKTILISRRDSVQDLMLKIRTVFNYYMYFVKKEKSKIFKEIRLWKSLTNNIDDIQQADKKYNQYSQVKINATPINIKEEDQKQIIEDANIADDDIIIAEIYKQNQSSWTLIPLNASQEESKSLVNDQVAINGVALDDFIHKDLNEVLTPKSRKGIVGLQNLGNTCFMNSGLQCLSNTIELTKYFCFGLYKQDINEDNPLGLGGKLAMVYADLNQEMWLGPSNRISPWDLKKVVGKKVSKFSGFGQQDTCELVNYVLDLLHEDLNRVKKKPYIEMKDYDGRPDEEVSKEHWDAFTARNQSIIVDLMYGQLKSTVTCQECNNLSVTFDPYLTLSLPIARPFVLDVYYVPYDICDQNQKASPAYQLRIALTKKSEVKDLKQKVSDIMKEDTELDDLVVANINVRQWQIDTKFKSSQSCQDIDQSTEDTVVYQLKPIPPGQDQTSYKLVEINFMKFVRYGSSVSGANLKKVLPRLERLNINMKIIELKRRICENLKYLDEVFEKALESDESLNEEIILHIVDNIPMEQVSTYSRRRGKCEFCNDRHGPIDSCDLKIDDLSGNSEEGCHKIQLADIYDQMIHKRDLKIGVLFKSFSPDIHEKLQPEFDNSHIKDMKKKQKESISLDSCFRAYSREELLTGADQWYCNKCKEQRDIMKKLELYKAPKILIIQLKRFQSKRSNSGQGGFLNLAYAQICQQEKVGEFVDFPIEGLDISPYLKGQENGEPIYYDLYAVSNHFGGLNGGHITAYGYNSLMKKWYEFNDSSVSSVEDPKEVVTAGAYILFYRKRE